MSDELYFQLLFWYYPVMVIIGMIGIFASRKRSWIWGILFLAVVTFAGFTEYQEVKKNEQFFIEELHRVLMDGVVDPGEAEQYDVEDDIWAGEEIGYDLTDVHEI